MARQKSSNSLLIGISKITGAAVFVNDENRGENIGTTKHFILVGICLQFNFQY